MEPKRQMFIGTAGEFARALEDWIIDNKCNPTTPEEWDRCISDIVKQGTLTPATDTDRERLKTANIKRIYGENKTSEE